LKFLNIHSNAKEVLAKKGKSFYWASHFLGKKYLQRATQLYSFCRYLDDMVDEEDDLNFAKLKIVEAQQAVLMGFSDHQILSDGLELLKQCQIPKDVVLDLISGIESDTQTVRIANEYELLRYCYQVAGTVGLMMCNTLDTNDPTAKPYAIDLGIAMQITNICRDIKADALVNRRYIPADLIENIDISHLISPSKEQARIIQTAVATLLALADTYYRSGEKGLPYLPLRARFSILIAVRIYRAIGLKLQSKHYEYWHRRIIVSQSRKLMITISAISSACFNPSFWFRPKNHDARLQKSLLNASEHYGFY
jgi:phytoene synthase